jgi:hypothetical protein
LLRIHTLLADRSFRANRKRDPGEIEPERISRIKTKAEPKEEIEEAKVEPIHPSEKGGDKKTGLLDTCM